MAPPPIALACLDMVGTTVEDRGLVDKAFGEALATEGLGPGEPGHREAWRYIHATMGESKIEVLAMLFAGDRQRAAAANAVFEEHYARGVAQGAVVAVPGASQTMAQFRNSGVKVCLTTGFSPSTRDAVLEALGWAEAVDLVMSPGPGVRGRPYPDMILAAVLALEVDDVAQVAVAGDTANDLWSGHRAGAGVVAGVLTGAHDRATLAGAPHTHILHSVAELPPLVVRG